ncbi:transposase [Dictyobacter formicarum]|uniref:IS4 family transposase n=1 Tax=Dictyobacter formicarum TaxID=2778368 RepID=A0ABQ3VH99_9CHLR|nr:transposase [Dictyobacter formicarum]GHO83713.1 IS4 family transposase [Dictyobacter formicarum]GHO85312.1 IS4 family transposase [Dictyobacter formicarum]GHO86929.1 IS4 family transposase [Dictyobacter formicarum]GHO88952.1 IS4 family transposase [Dictyobacter formicarum]GHO89478.1 IS4 family transposase [Dictyobacter formicarum]
MSSRPHHTQKCLTEQSLGQMDDAQWQEIIALLPPDVNEQAFIHHAFTRANGLRCPTDLLRGIFAYVFCLGSFREVGTWSVSTGLSTNGARSWAKRTRQSSSWLLAIVQTLLVSTQPEEVLDLPKDFTGRIRLVDATHLRTWKRSGESRRLHCSYDLLGKRLDQVLLTDHHVGEGLKHFHGHRGDIFVGDSAYCRRQAILDQLDEGVDVVTRLHWSTMPLLEADGQTPFDLSGWLSQLEPTGKGEASVVFQVRKRQQPMRLLAVHLSPEAAKRAHSKRKAKARKNGSTNQALTIQIADWLVVLTSLPADHWSAEQVLMLYRTRWQIELLFKRIKQLVRLHRLRSEHFQSNQAVLAAMMVGWILLEQQVSQVRRALPSKPTKHAAGPVSTWAICALLAQSLRTMIVGTWTWSQIRASLSQLHPVLMYHPQNRVHQESETVTQLAQTLYLSSL